MTTRDNIKNSHSWLRLLYILLFALIFSLAELLLWSIVVLQFGFQLFTSQPNARLLEFSRGFNAYLWQIVQFVSYRSEEKPYPFNDWPKEGVQEQEPELVEVSPPLDGDDIEPRQ